MPIDFVRPCDQEVEGQRKKELALGIISALTKNFTFLSNGIGRVQLISKEGWIISYSCLFEFVFNKQEIKEITITDHAWKKEVLELILDILKVEINGIKKMRPDRKYRNKDIFVRQRISYQEKKYKLIFWFKDGTNNHLWIRNCHQQD